VPDVDGDRDKARVDAVRDSTADRYRLAAEFYGGQHAKRACSRYRRAELSSLRWEIERGVLDAISWFFLDLRNVTL
jgi:hypothetical protein